MPDAERRDLQDDFDALVEEESKKEVERRERLASEGARRRTSQRRASPDEPQAPRPIPGPQKEAVTSITLAQARAEFRRWLSDAYDTSTLDATLCACAVKQLGGDPLWVLIISGPGNAKTETVSAARGAGARTVSTIASEGALLSATSQKERNKDATGGLLREIGEEGILVIKDMTSILSMDRNTRGSVLAALREIYDGQWKRVAGSGGGQSLEWRGRIIIIGACTTAWDQAHAVISAMGDRFVLVRSDSSDPRSRLITGQQAMANTGRESEMRDALAAAVKGVLAGINPDADLTLSTDEKGRLLAAANLVTQARTAVTRDQQGNVIDRHDFEAPQRFAKQLVQLVRGGLALGMDRNEAMTLAIRCARDSMPPLRLAILLDVAAHPGSTTRDVRQRLNKPRSTVDRALQELHMLELLDCDEEPFKPEERGGRWSYTLRSDHDLSVLDPSPLPRKVTSRGVWGNKGVLDAEDEQDGSGSTHISGQGDTEKVWNAPTLARLGTPPPEVPFPELQPGHVRWVA